MAMRVFSIAHLTADGSMTNDPFSFTITATDGRARTGFVSTARGRIRTPAFMPVGTAGTVKAMHPEEVWSLGADIVLGNVCLLYTSPSPRD